MSNAIRFLEAVGGSPNFIPLTQERMHALVESMEVERDKRSAILRADVGELLALTDARNWMALQVWAPDEEPFKREDDMPEEAPGDEDEEEES